MRKYPAAKDFDAIAGTLPSNARGDGGHTPVIVAGSIADKDDTKCWLQSIPPPSAALCRRCKRIIRAEGVLSTAGNVPDDVAGPACGPL